MYRWINNTSINDTPYVITNSNIIIIIIIIILNSSPQFYLYKHEVNYLY